MKTYLTKALSLFFILGMIFIPLQFYLFDYQYPVTRFIFTTPVAFIERHLFAHALTNIDFSSDTISLNLLLHLLSIMALILATVAERLKINSLKIATAFSVLSAYYVAAVLLKYGFDKVFKHQFSLPEPNILYSNFGTLTKDILFWSTIGLSRAYSVITGSLEIITALLILVRPTRILGFCIAIGVFINILVVNFSFDISVKTFSTFLLLMTVFNICPYLKRMYAFFVQGRQVQLKASTKRLKRIEKWGNVAIIAGLIIFTLSPYISTGNYNDDQAPRPLLHGAYNITGFKIGTDTLSSAGFPYKRIFIHRNNYIIFQRRNEEMIDYFFEMDMVKKQLNLYDYDKHVIVVNYDFDAKNGRLQLKFKNKTGWTVNAETMPWKTLPALQNNVHYTIDEIR